jgi:GNAT superfamily N-acetyltransferase
MRVRRVGRVDWEVVRELRLRALVNAPEAFGSTHEREVAFPNNVWIDRLGTATNATFVCDADGGPCGVVTMVRDASDARLGWRVGMWVEPSVRGTGAADLLVRAAMTWAEEECLATVRFLVMDDNDCAGRLYRRHGFRSTGARLYETATARARS